MTHPTREEIEKALGAKLHSTMDAQVWAEEFWKIWGNRLTELDQGLMLSWFANSIMCGYDIAHQRMSSRLPDTSASDEEAKGIAIREEQEKWDNIRSSHEIDVVDFDVGFDRGVAHARASMRDEMYAALIGQEHTLGTRIEILERERDALRSQINVIIEEFESQCSIDSETIHHCRELIARFQKEKG